VPRALLILDNIDDARLLHPPHTDLLSGRPWLHVLATTRLGPQQLSPDDVRHRLLAVDELPADDALRLIESYQPQGRFANDDERTAAREIVTLLQGFTLAVEVVAVHLAERGGRLTCAALRDRLKAEGLTGLENIAGKTTRGIPHVERLVTVTLAPTLAALSEPESMVLTLAALLPADHIPLPWLRDVAGSAFPDLAQDAEPGHDDPWLTLVNHVISLRLLQVVELAPDGQTPRLCGIHRLVQEVVTQTWPDDLAYGEQAMLDHIKTRATFLRDSWSQVEHRWELVPLTACADHWLARDGDAGPWIANHLADPLEQLGKFSAAERLSRSAVERMQPGDPGYAACLNDLAKVLMATNRLAEAETLFRRALTNWEKAFSPNHPDIAAACNNLAVLLYSTNRLTEAETLYRRALAIIEKSRGPRHPDVASQLNNLAYLLMETNRPAEAEPLFRRALAIEEASYGPDHPTVATGLNNLALLLQHTNRLSEAESLCRRALAIDKASLGADHPSVAVRLNNLATLLEKTNRPAEAEPLFRRALAIDEASFGPDHPNVARESNNLANLLKAASRLTEAEPLFRRALAIWEKSLGTDHPLVADALNNLAGLLYATDRITDAEEHYRRALAIAEASYGRDHPSVATTLNNLAALLMHTNRLTEAETLYRRALAIGEASLGPNHPAVAARLNNLSLLLRATNRLTEAESLSRRQVKILLRFAQANGHEHPQFRLALNNYAGLLVEMGRTPEQISAQLDKIGRRFGVTFGVLRE
jgi:tetratricopeptide (TPR) repeat protein